MTSRCLTKILTLFIFFQLIVRLKLYNLKFIGIMETSSPIFNNEKSRSIMRPPSLSTAAAYKHSDFENGCDLPNLIGCKVVAELLVAIWKI